MPNIDLQLSGRTSRILVGNRLDEVADLVPAGKVVLITDENLYRHYGNRLPWEPAMVLPPGEGSKDLDRVRECYERLAEAEVDRNSFVLGMGGGVVCDVTGFVASTYMRGIPFAFIATSLLAQVDAAIGGKNGVNFSGYKNLIGVINQPEFVLCDPIMLDTLEDARFLEGFAEIIKYGAIYDAEFFSYMEQHAGEGLRGKKDVLGHMILSSVRAKCSIVEGDEFEEGRRKILNFGHTFGHALEKVLGISHGEAVSVGMVVAGRISVKLGMLGEEEFGRLYRLISGMGLPAELDYDAAAMLAAIRMDKKRSGDRVGLILLEELGRPVIREVGFNALNDLVNDLH